MRPEAPVPGTVARSTLFSEAILRTSGEERGRSPAEAAAAGAAGAGAAAGAFAGAAAGAAAFAAGAAAPPPMTATTVLMRDGRAFGDLDLGERAGDGRRNLGVDLVGGDLEDGLVALNGVADLLEPLGDGAFSDGFAHLRHQDFGARTGGSTGAIAGRRSEGLRFGLLVADGSVQRTWSNGVFLRGHGAGVRRSGGLRAVFIDSGDDCVDADGGAFLHLDLAKRAGDGRGDLGVDLVGGDLEQRFVALDGVARLLQPLGEGAFGDGFAHLGHDYVGRHREVLRGAMGAQGAIVDYTSASASLRPRRSVSGPCRAKLGGRP